MPLSQGWELSAEPRSYFCALLPLSHRQILTQASPHQITHAPACEFIAPPSVPPSKYRSGTCGTGSDLSGVLGLNSDLSP